MHSHDVRALAVWPPYTPLPISYQRHFALDVAPVLASGGLDMSVVLTPAAPPRNTIVKVTNPLNTSLEATFEDSYHRKIGYTAAGRVQVARGARLVSCVRESGLSVWRISKKRGSPENFHAEQEVDLDADDEPSGGWERVLEMELTVHSNIVSHEISDDGKWLTVSDLYETKLFSLHTNVSDV
jgi:U3 small nucleolar RNA-associated protein 4